MTRAQRLAEADHHDRLHGPDKAEVVHSFPDDWTVRRLTSSGDEHREGALMGHCLHNDTAQAYAEEGDPRLRQELSYGPAHEHRYSLRDPDNLPHVTFDHHPPNTPIPWNHAATNPYPDAGVLREIYGQHNGWPKDKYMARVQQYVNAQPWPTQIADGFDLDGEPEYDSPERLRPYTQGTDPNQMQMFEAKTARPVDDIWWDEHNNGGLAQSPAASPRYWYHATSLPRARKILQEGLRPWDEVGQTNYDGYLKPRPGHVYLTSDLSRAKQHAFESHAHLTRVPSLAILRVHPASLDPNRINPDEDAHPAFSDGIPAEDDFPDTRSLGQYAEDEGWGDYLPVSHDAIEGHQSLAYRGMIPASALELHLVQPGGEWQPWMSPSPAILPSHPATENPSAYSKTHAREVLTHPDISQPSVMYHSTLKANSPSIQQYGLDPTRGKSMAGQAVYLTEQPMASTDAVDVYRVDVTGLPLEPDPIGNGRDGHWFTREHIGP
jgi:hypothetical protein